MPHKIWPSQGDVGMAEGDGNLGSRWKREERMSEEGQEVIFVFISCFCVSVAWTISPLTLLP